MLVCFDYWFISTISGIPYNWSLRANLLGLTLGEETCLGIYVGGAPPCRAIALQLLSRPSYPTMPSLLGLPLHK
jgi:hypothetical protein